jgi:hypothetical protein
MKRMVNHLTDEGHVRLVTRMMTMQGFKRYIKNVAQIDAATGYSLPIKAESDATPNATDRA